MRNIDRLSKIVTKEGADGIMIHTLAGTRNWIVAQKIEINKWLITLLNPMGNVTYNLGTVNESEHLLLWQELTKAEIENKLTQITIAKELKKKIQYFLKNYDQTYKKITKINEKNTKQNRIKLRRRTKRLQKINI